MTMDLYNEKVASSLTAMNSVLDPTNCLKQRRKFSSVGKIWASWWKVYISGLDTHTSKRIENLVLFYLRPWLFLSISYQWCVKNMCSSTSDISILPSLFLSNFCMNSVIFSLKAAFDGSCVKKAQQDESSSHSLLIGKALFSLCFSG